MTITYTDLDVTFCLHVAREPQLASWCLTNLRKVYPYCNLIVIADGDYDSAYTSFQHRFNARLVYDKSLFQTQYGGLVIQRMLHYYLDSPTKYLFKIDCDSYIKRRFKNLPSENGVFGTIEASKGKTIAIHGGCQGYTQASAEKIYDSKILRDEKLASKPEETWAIDDKLKAMALTKGFVSIDWIVSYCCYKLGISLFEFKEIYSISNKNIQKWQERIIENQGNNFAVTHPYVPPNVLKDKWY